MGKYFRYFSSSGIGVGKYSRYFSCSEPAIVGVGKFFRSFSISEPPAVVSGAVLVGFNPVVVIAASLVIAGRLVVVKFATLVSLLNLPAAPTGPQRSIATWTSVPIRRSRV